MSDLFQEYKPRPIPSTRCPRCGTFVSGAPQLVADDQGKYTLKVPDTCSTCGTHIEFES